MRVLSAKLEMKIDDVVDQIDGISIQSIIFRIILHQSYFNWNWWHWHSGSSLDDMQYYVNSSLNMEIMSDECEINGQTIKPYSLYHYTFSQQRFEDTEISKIWDQFIIIPEFFSGESYRDSDPLQVIFTQSIFKQFIEHLDSLKFNILDGVFRSTTKGLDWSPLYSLKNIVLFSPIDQCVVCYESTRTQTQCKHFLCLLCVVNIKIIPKRCPLCRSQPLIMLKP